MFSNRIIHFSIYLQRIFVSNAKQNYCEKAARAEIFEENCKIPTFRTLPMARWLKGPWSYASFRTRRSNFAMPSNGSEEIREIPRESRGNNEVVMETRLSSPVGTLRRLDGS